MRLSQQATVVALCAVAIAIGLEMWSTPASEPSDASARLLPIIRRSHEREHAAMRGRDSLSRVAARASLRHEASSALFAIDTTTPAPGLALTPTSDDTTSMGWIVRGSDGRKFVTPLFFITAYEDAVQAYNYQRMLVLYDSSTVFPLKDTLITQLHALADSNKSEAEWWKRKANPRCGRRCAAVVGAIATLFVVQAAHRAP